MLLRPRQKQMGFTLLETILAVSLISLLIVCIVATTSLYAQYQHRGIEGARKARVLLGTIQDLQNDLHACFAIDEPAHSQSLNRRETSPSTPPQFSTSSGEERVLTFDSKDASPIRFVGRSNAILLLRQGSNPRFENLNANLAASQHQVLWLAPGTTSMRLPKSTDGSRVVEKEYKAPQEKTALEDGSHLPALARMSVAAPVLQAMKTQSISSERIAAAEWERNAEVKEARFRFFDGTTWHNEWNSHLVNQRVPLAVEVKLKFTFQTDEFHRIVIGMPE